MLVAICDDNVADRKQIERLMDREADVFIKAGDPLYIYSYGNIGSLFANFMQFDAIFVDIGNSGAGTLDKFLDLLNQNGGNSIVVVTDNECNIESDKCIKLPKPFYQDKLRAVLLDVKFQRTMTHTNKIELRGSDRTVYAEPEDVLYAQLDKFGTRVYLKDGSNIKITVDPQTFFDNIEPVHKSFVLAATYTVVNVDNIEKIGFNRAIMRDGKKITLALSAYLKAKKLMGKTSKEE